MAFDGMTAMGLVAAGAGLLSVAAWSWRIAFGRRAISRKLLQAGFEPDGASFVLRQDGVEVRAFIRDGMVHIEGPQLPPDTPTFHPTSAGMAVGPVAVRSGDLDFDRTVRTEHPDPHVGLAWLQSDVRRAARDAIEQSLVIVDHRWRYEGTLTPLLDVKGVASALVRASGAMSEAPSSVESALEHLARTDPIPQVRAHAIDVLGERQANPDRLVDLAQSRHPDVLLALVRRGGTAAATAWGALQEVGTAAERLEGTLAAGRSWAAGRLAGLSEDRIVEALLETLSDNGRGGRAAEVLASVDRPSLQEELDQRFGHDPPPAARKLLKRLERRAAGAVSLASPVGGEVSVAKD